MQERESRFQLKQGKLKTVVLGILCFSVFACATSNKVQYQNSNRGDADTITGYLSKPDGDGPFSAVVLLHGCTGLERDTNGISYKGLLRYQAVLRDAGFVSIIVDSYGSRGRTTESLRHTSCPSMKYPERYVDLTGAIRYLKSLPYVKPRIGAVGLSQGATTLVRASGWRGSSVRKQLLSAAIAIYPGCNLHPDDIRIPLLILIGDADNITPVERCQRWLNHYRTVVDKRLDENGQPIGIMPEMVIYPGVHHSYDLPIRGIVYTPLGTVKADSDATKDSRKRVIAFFRKYL